MIQKKNFISAIKKALQTGSFSYIGQQLTQFPEQLYNIQSLKLDDQNWWQCNPITKVDMSNNQIVAIPNGIVNLADLQVFRMRNNMIKQIGKWVIGFENLKSLDLGRNKLERLPEQIGMSKSLVQINFSQNMLEYCPNLDKVKTLQLVYLNNNKLKQLPNFGQAIKKIQLQQNQIKSILRQSFQKCVSLQTLNLNKNHIESIQDGSFINLKNLTILQLKQNRIQHIRQLPNSQKLDSILLSFNRLTQFSYFDRCPNLTALVLSDNKIKNISKDIIKLKKLKTLDLANNDLPDLPSEIGFLRSLVRIQLQGNPLKTMRQNIRTGGTNVIQKYLQDKMDPKQRQKMQKSISTSFQKVSDNQYWSKLLYEFTQSGELILRKMNITALDQLVFEKNLKGINVTDNKITNISENIYKLDQLKYLIVNNNQLQSLPNSLQRLPNLQQIQAKNNQLSDFIVTSPYGYPKLHFLDLSANRIKYIPKGILILPKLRTLHLSYNQISDIQLLLQNPKLLPYLQILDVSNNKISDISDNIYMRVSLNYINLENNNLGKIPTVLGFMKLSGLKIDGNPLKLIKRAVIDKGTVAILQYLRTKHSGQLPQRPQNIIPVQKPEYVMKPQKPNYPYQTQPVATKNIDHPSNNYNNPPSNYNQNNNFNSNYKPQQSPQIHQQQSLNSDKQRQQQKIRQLQIQIKKIQDQLDNNMGMNTMMKNQKKKIMQSLMIEKNKLIKGE